MQIPELENPYYVKLPITCEYAGETYTLDLSVRLIGEKMNPIAEVKKSKGCFCSGYVATCRLKNGMIS